MTDLTAHVPSILEQFDNGATAMEIAENLSRDGIKNGFNYDKSYHVRKVLRAYARVPQAHKRGESVGELLLEKCPHCGKNLCPHCGKPI